MQLKGIFSIRTVYVLSAVCHLAQVRQLPEGPTDKREEEFVTPSNSTGRVPVATCEEPPKDQDFDVIGSCELYAAGDLCAPYRTNQTVYVDGRKQYYDQTCLMNNLRNVLNLLSKQTSPEIKALSKDDLNKCLQVQLQGICNYFFPDCSGTSSWKRMCRESCKDTFGKGHVCSDLFSLTKSALTTLFHDKTIFALHIDSEDFSCTNLPSKSQGNCFDFEVPRELRLGSNHLVLILCVILPAIAVIGIVSGLIIAFRRRQASATEMQNDSFNNRSYGAPPFVDVSVRSRISNILSSSSCTVSERSMIIDPSYSIDDFPEVSLDTIGYVRDLGEGEFGKVFLGTLNCRSNESEPLLVAVKTLKSNSDDDDDDEKAEKNFFAELEIVTQLRHENIVCLLAKWLTDAPRCLIFEFMCYGDLNQVLRSADIGDEQCLYAIDVDEETEAERKHVVTVADLISMVSQVCCGLRYLASRRFVHRDLATRNCLVGKELSVKISDFGLTRDIYSRDYYRAKGLTPLPIRWMAPESIMYGKYVVASDVWSFGVLMWEVFTLGKQPYYGMSNEEVVIHVAKAGVLPSADHFCPDSVSNLMKTCWMFEPKDRPSADQLLDNIQQLS